MKSDVLKEDRLAKREDLIFNVTEDLLLLMEDRGITKTELARTLGKSKAFVTQILSGSRNMTLGTLSDIVFSLKSDLKVEVADRSITHYQDLRAEPEHWECAHVSAPKPLKKVVHIRDFKRDSQSHTSWCSQHAC